MHRLPEPGREELAHSARLAHLIAAEIDATGPMSFARYMALALYAPGLGYYSAGRAKFGAAGDFVTAPELGDVFARCLARTLAPVLASTNGELIEHGGGSGVLAADLLLALEALGQLPRRYAIVEVSADLRARQRESLEQRAAHLIDRVTWLDGPPTTPWRGAVIANEVADALPVIVFERRDDAWLECCVTHAPDAAGDAVNFAWTARPLPEAHHALVTRALEAGGPWPSPYRSEISPMLAPWFQAIAGTLEQGVVVINDYAYPRREHYLAQRHQGTLLCYYRHRGHDDPLLWPGLCDITAFVDATALAEAGTSLGFDLACYAPQAQFLIASGLPEILSQSATLDAVEHARLIQQVRRLTLPGEMGERFKTFVFARGLGDAPLACADANQAFRL